MRKGHYGEKKWKKIKKIMMFIVATNVVASRPPERRPTRTPHARANRFNWCHVVQNLDVQSTPCKSLHMSECLCVVYLASLCFVFFVFIFLDTCCLCVICVLSECSQCVVVCVVSLLVHCPERITARITPAE